MAFPDVMSKIWLSCQTTQTLHVDSLDNNGDCSENDVTSCARVRRARRYTPQQHPGGLGIEGNFISRRGAGCTAAARCS
jgi:hypothetical protein